MLSRIADSLYWMNRYMERADGLLRVASIHYILGMDRDAHSAATWKPILQLFATIPDHEMTFLENNSEEALKKLLVESTNNNSLKMMINRARENARGAQDHLTKEVWEQINQMYHLVNNPSVIYQLSTYQTVDVMKELVKQVVLYIGTIDITMPRGNGWYFMCLGRYVERCLQTLVLIEKELEIMNPAENETNDILQWRHLLLCLSGYELHLKSYRTSNHNYNALHQMVANENFPHSVVYSLRRLDHYLKRIIQNCKTEGEASLLRTFGRLYGKVRYMDHDTLTRGAIQPFLTETKSDLLSFTRQLEQHFFSYS